MSITQSGARIIIRSPGPQGPQGATGNVLEGIGTDDTVLIADSTQGEGVRWEQIGDDNVSTLSPSKITGTAVVQARTVTGTGSLTGGGDLSANRTIDVADQGINTSELADSAVTSAKIADSAVTSAKIADGTIVDGDIATGAGIAPSKIAGTALVASSVDAKGDLLVGTGADAVARLGAGADGTLVVADSNEVTGVRWAQVADANLADGAVTTAKLADGAVTFAKTSKVAPVSLLASKPAINGYVGPAFGTTGVGEVQRHNSFFCGIWLHPGTLDRIGVEVTTAQASTTVRLGIYGTSTDGLPTGAPILDAGTVDASTTGFKEITVSQAISAAGWYWLSATAQGGSGADVQVRRIIGGTRQPVAAIATRIVDASPAVVGIRTMGGTTSGALPTIGALNYGDSTTPQIVVRYSAVS